MIKKFLFAISAVALLTACGGNAGETSKAEGSNEATTEQTAEATTGDNGAPAAGKAFDKKSFTVSIPESWTIVSDLEDKVSAKTVDEKDNSGYLYIQTYVGTVDELINNKKFDPAKSQKLDNVKFGDIDYQVYGEGAGYAERIYLFAPMTDGAFEVKLEDLKLDNPEVKAILETIKLK